MSIALDAVTERIFDNIKGKNTNGPYRWKEHHEALKNAVDVFGAGSISTHLIIGLGETEKESIQKIQWCLDSGIHPALFAFTPITGTAFEKKDAPKIDSYRRVQIAQYILIHKKTHTKKMKFNKNGQVENFGVSKKALTEIIESGTPFLTSGCPGCNRPYYNEKPGGPFYNYPRKLQNNEIEDIKNLLEI